MGCGETIVIIPSTHMLNNIVDAARPYQDDVSDLESTEDHVEHRQQKEEDSDDSSSLTDEEEDFFPDFPPNFDFQSKSIPPHFLCPLTKSIMIHPVIDAEGNTYEKRAILRWLDLEDISPVTGNSLSPMDLVENKRRMDAIEKYREEVWTAYNDEDPKYKTLFKQEKKFKEKQQMMRKERQKFKRKDSSKSQSKHDMLADKSSKLLLQMQEELNLLQGQQDQGEKAKDEVEALADSHVDYLLRKKVAEEDKPKSAVMDRIIQRRRSGTLYGGDEAALNSTLERKQTADVVMNRTIERRRESTLYGGAEVSLISTVERKHSSRKQIPSPHKELKDYSPEKSLIVRQSSMKSSNSPPQASLRSSGTSKGSNNHRNSLESSYSSLYHQKETKKSFCEYKTYKLRDPDVQSSMESLALVQQSIPSPPLVSRSERKRSPRRQMSDSKEETKAISRSKKVPTPPPPKISQLVPKAEVSRRQSRKSSSSQIKDAPSYSITDRIIADVNGECVPLANAPKNVNPTTASTTSESQASKLDHGWSVPIGVHKVICDAPGLLVTCDVHRRSAPVKRMTGAGNKTSTMPRRRHMSDREDLIVPPGTYIEVLETQVHGDRVRGRVAWEESVLVEAEETHKAMRKNSFKSLSKFNPKKSKVATVKQPTEKKLQRYTGWVSLRWAGEPNVNKTSSKLSDEDAGPWTEPVSIGVYTVTFSHGLPVRKTSDRNSALVGMLEKGQYVEVVETQISGDRVRARCIPAPNAKEEKSLNGWISLFNAVSGSSGVSPVPLGAYVTVNESGCTVSEGGSLKSRVRHLLKRGSCVDVVSTRIEDGTVRGLLSTGGYVTLFNPKRSRAKRNSTRDEQYLMHVPIGVYRVATSDGLPVFMGVETNTPSFMELPQDSYIEIAETQVSTDGRVCGRIIAVINGNDRYELQGWIHLFEKRKRYCKFVRSS